MIKNLFRPRHLLDPWRDNFVIALKLRNISGNQIGDALAQVDAHCTDSGEAPEEAFGDPVAYATHVAEQVRPVDLALSMSPRRAGLLGLAVLFAAQRLDDARGKQILLVACHNLDKLHGHVCLGSSSRWGASLFGEGSLTGPAGMPELGATSERPAEGLARGSAYLP